MFERVPTRFDRGRIDLDRSGRERLVSSCVLRPGGSIDVTVDPAGGQVVAGSNPVSPTHCRSKTVSEKSGAVFFRLYAE